ncbi:Pimeloyl-ACP methyl ester carboxylesterase [Streptomyces sp. WMMB 714]|uniref:alpha/beta fold hydrolase n=1 Tax=Streptomyces sp. WMMB 714 TaxID=1286822 RepID=UPI000823E875|nr:alpha/beta fold hydrolase [Streptomyces sp. WMMB 714]SCK51308.1 Pimeloyl-ACP methyl ester carboxylesterase [Streptomyces sp. WMMB 714]
MFLPIAIGQILASAETLSLKEVFDDDGYLRGVSAQQYPPGSLRHRLGRVLDHRRTPKVLAGVTLAASAGLAMARGNRKAQIAAAAVIGTCNRLSEIRTPYGRDGADQMTAVITQYRALTALIPDEQVSDDLFLRAVNFQAGLSYAVSGISKAFGSSWLQGDALPEVLQTEAYGSGPAAELLRRHPRLCRALTIGTVAWETAFPLVYVLPRKQASYALSAVKSFHLGVAATMELPRFVWGFVGSHGAVGYALDTRGERRTFEKSVAGIAAGVTLASALIAREKRQIAEQRRIGPKGASRLRSEIGDVEYAVDHPVGGPDHSMPAIVLECGLGQSLESWEWVAERLAVDHTVIRYHRSGYGFTKSRASSGDILAAVLEEAGVKGDIAVVTHSIGSLSAASYARDSRFAGRIRKLVVVDGTDPELLEADRSDRRRLGKFVQVQVHTLFAALTGIYEWAPNAVERQAGYTPDTQYSHVQFVFTPKNIVNSIREYKSIATDEALADLAAVESVLVVASGENAEQQSVLAKKLGAGFELVAGSAHRSIIGNKNHAEKVEGAIRRFIHAE